MADESGPGIEEMGLSTQDLSTEKVELQKPPQFIRRFSKEHSVEERQQQAQAIRSKRAEYFDRKGSLQEQQTALKESVAVGQEGLREHAENLARQEAIISSLSESWFSRMIRYSKLAQLRKQYSTDQQLTTQMNAEVESLLTEEQQVAGQLRPRGTPAEFQEAKDMLGSFYGHEQYKWTTSEFSKDDLSRYFTEEHLSSLSMEDYILLLSRFPNEMVTHVTRQGIRDHIGGDFHSAGLGEYADGFRNILSEGRLQSSIGIFFKEGTEREAIARALEIGGTIKTREDAEKMLDQYREGDGPGSYADRSAVHFALEEVGDRVYGSERGNEIFFAFPSAYIASQEFHNSKLTTYNGQNDYNEPQYAQDLGGNHNDKWVWTNNRDGISLNAGLVFIPSDAQVDRKTGSRYALDQEGKPIEIQDNIDLMKRCIDSDRFQEVLSRFDFSISGGTEELRDVLQKELGVTDPVFQEIILARSNLENMLRTRSIDEDVRRFNTSDVVAREVLRQSGVLYTLASDTVSSREYWEGYFIQNPSQRPKRTVYYEGGDPTQALNSWREENGIMKRSTSVDFGFPESVVGQDIDTHPASTFGMERFLNIAREVIDEHFPVKRKARGRKKVA